jgi:hypothetical protein
MEDVGNLIHKIDNKMFYGSVIYYPSFSGYY